MLRYVHHVEYVVQDLNAMVSYIEKNFGMKPNSRHERKGRVEAYYDIGKTQLQLSSPTDPKSDHAEFLAKHGPGVYHVAWAVDDARATAQSLAAKGVKLWAREGKGEKVFASENVDGTVVCNIDPPDSLGLWFQLVSPKETA